MPTAAARSAPGRHGRPIRPARCPWRPCSGPRPGTTRSRSAGRRAGTSRTRTRTVQGAPGVHGPRVRRSTAVTTPGRRRGGWHDRQAVGLRRGWTVSIRSVRRPGAGRRRRRCRRAGRRPPAGRPRRGPRPTSSHAPIRRPAVGAPPLVERLSAFGSGARRTAVHRPVRCPLADPGLPTIARTSAASSARTAVAVDRGAADLHHLRATLGHAGHGQLRHRPVELGQELRRWLDPDAELRPGAPARSASRVSTAVTVDTTLDDDLPLGSSRDG